jgi:hypothetical protein
MFLQWQVKVTGEACDLLGRTLAQITTLDAFGVQLEARNAI